MTRAVIYSRVSTSRQAEHDLSMPDQVNQCRSFCERNDWQVVEIFEEPGASALDEDRPVFQEMIYRAKRAERPFDVVVVHSLSRFSRASFHSEMYVRELNKAGVKLVSITQSLTTDPTGEMLRKLLNVFDEHASRENAKHVHRAMMENARQGFWNGSKPPFGYTTQVAERRGAKDKKALIVKEDEAVIVRMIFDKAMGVDGRPMGVKNIALWLTDQGCTRRGVRFSTGSVHEILTTTAYHGRHHFNRFDSRSRRPRPPSEWITLDVPPIIPEETFNIVQALLQSRAPSRVPPRVTTSPTMLAGVARCGSCGTALIQNTGKGGRYRYYCCSRKLKEGPSSCEGVRMPMGELDGIVIDELARRILEPSRLAEMLEAYVKASAAQEGDAKDKLSRLRHVHTEAKAAVSRLLAMVASGLMDEGDPEFREQLASNKIRRDEASRQIDEMRSQMSSGEPILTPEKIERVAALLNDKLHNGPPDLRQAYARLLVDEVRVTRDEIRIIGSKAVLARAASHGANIPAPAVLSFVQEWRARRDSNS